MLARVGSGRGVQGARVGGLDGSPVTRIGGDDEVKSSHVDVDF